VGLSGLVLDARVEVRSLLGSLLNNGAHDPTALRVCFGDARLRYVMYTLISLSELLYRVP
jgi:hypothetical protein